MDAKLKEMKKAILLLSTVLLIVSCGDLFVKDDQGKESGDCSMNVSADKMNILYVGVDNPISVAGNSSEFKVSCSGGGCIITNTGKLKYNVRVSQPGQIVTINLSSGSESTYKKFRVKQMPDPKPCIGSCNKNAMGPLEFKGQEGIYAKLENFDIDAKCKIDGFEFTRIPKASDPIVALNRGGRFSEESIKMRNAAKPGDIYLFYKIKSRCPGDRVGRQLPAIIIMIR